MSHRWESKEAPDKAGIQMHKILKHLETHRDIQLIWYDYWSMPQGDERTPAEKVEFKWSTGRQMRRERLP